YHGLDRRKDQQLGLTDEVAQIASSYHGRVADRVAEIAQRRPVWPRQLQRATPGRTHRSRRARSGIAASGRLRRCAVLARRRAGQLQENVVERRPAQAEVAYGDPRLSQSGGSV